MINTSREKPLQQQRSEGHRSKGNWYFVAIIMGVSSLVGLLALGLQVCFAHAAVELDVNITAVTTEVDSDWTSIFYSKKAPLLLGNDGGPDKGGFHVYALGAESPLTEVTSRVTGRTKLLTTLYDVDGEDLVATIAMPDSVIRFFSAPSFEHVESADFKLLGDWSAICSWESNTGNHYLYLFGKKQGVQLLVSEEKKKLKTLEVQTFDLPFESSGCAVSRSQSRMYLSSDDDKTVYAFPLKESTKAPELSEVGKASDDVTGLAVYVGKNKDYLFVSQTDVVDIYDSAFKSIAQVTLGGYEDIEIQGLNIYQGAAKGYPVGALTFALESDEANGFGTASLQDILDAAGITENTSFDPRKVKTDDKNSPIRDTCSNHGFDVSKTHKATKKCECFAGFSGDKCQKNTCVDDCSGNGKCVGPNVCKCKQGWGGLHCSFLLVEPDYETDANGGDGDDPAIWISPVARNLSRVITTTKSEEGAGLGVFDLEGKLLQTFSSGEPNNVDIIYGFKVGDRDVDLTFAACRADDTLCFAEVLSNGTLVEIAGGVQPVVDDYTVYGSCTYRSPKTGKQYVFVNEKSARYLQYELTATSNGTLQTTLVRDFQGGSGGQVEGCVTDEENGWIFIGEEPSALWRYGAEPDDDEEGFSIAKVGDGHLYGDVEGVTLVLGPTPDQGFILNSCQGVSAYNVYRRAAPHEFVTTFTITESADGQVDAVSNTDGITAVGAALNEDFPYGLVVVHDDANQLPNGSTSAEASFKLISLEKILGSKSLGERNLLDDVDRNWDPRK